MRRSKRGFTSGPWHGWLAYDSSLERRCPMELELTFDGTAVRGAGRDEDGPFSVMGELTPPHELRLEKRREGDADVRVVELVGKWDPRAGTLSGRWRVGGKRHGVFALEPGEDTTFPRIARQARDVRAATRGPG